jgi:hypothetical protein
MTLADVKLTQQVLLACASLVVLGFDSLNPVFAAGPAGFAGTLSGNYGHSIREVGPNGSLWQADAQAAYGFGMSNIAVEVDGGYRYLSSDDGEHITTWGIAGHVFWAPPQGRVGGTVRIESSKESAVPVSLPGEEFGSLTFDHALYGGFFEFNLGDQITLGVFGGEYAIYFPDDRPAFKNAYLGGGGTFYVIPDLALSGVINYRHIYEDRAALEFSAVAEWLVSTSVPISIFAGYQHRSYTSSGSYHVQLWSLGLKFYTSGNGTNLRDKHRNGALDRLVQPVGQLDLGI